MEHQKILLTDESGCDTWFVAVNGLIGIAYHQAEQGDMEEAKRIASNVAKILDEAYADLKKALGYMQSHSTDIYAICLEQIERAAGSVLDTNQGGSCQCPKRLLT